MTSAANADMWPAEHGEPGPWGLPRPIAWVRWVGWALANRAFTRHHLLSYLRMARASARCRSLRFEVREGYGRLVVGAYTHVGTHSRIRAHEGTLRIGRKSVIGIRNTVNCWLDISIGEACLFGDDVYVCDFDHRTDDLAIPVKDQGIAKSPVRIGDDVWHGTKVVVTRGTDIDDHSVVAAAAVARGVYPPKVVVAGVPGKVVRSRG